MSDVLDDYLDLPEDPELQLVAFEKRLRSNLNESIRTINRDTHEQYVLSEIGDRQMYYATRLMGFHDAHGFVMLTKPNLWRSGDNFENEFDAFLDEVTYWTTQIEVRHANRLRPISTVLQLTPEVRQQLHSYINKIRETVAPLQLPEKKKEAILGKLNSLADEVDRDRTKTEAWTAFVLGPVDKPIPAAARPERLGRCNTTVATGVMRRSAGAPGKQRIKGFHSRFRKES
jgi:hypothetical protein